MSTDAEGSVTYLLRNLNSGDRAAAEGMMRRFMPRLIGLARKTLTNRPQRHADAEDAVQSALVSFWQHLNQGDFPGPFDRENLWNLLGLITVRKAQRHARRERAEKRGGGKVLGENDLAARGTDPDRPFRLEETLAGVPAPDFDLECEELLLSLDDELRQFAMLRLLGHTTAEIAAELGCTQRKVQRKIALIGLRWQRALAE